MKTNEAAPGGVHGENGRPGSGPHGERTGRIGVADARDARADAAAEGDAGAVRGTPAAEDPAAVPADADGALEHTAGLLLALLGEDPERPGLVDTPRRMARALRRLTDGYDRDPREVIGDAVFEADHDSMVLVRDIELYSLCEHHMLPFYGRAHVAYVPDGRIVGLSKLARVVDVFARRLQVQERLTDQIADAIRDVLRPRGVAVVIEARHLCMMMRGVEKQNSKTITSAMRGEYLESAATREEFLRLVHGSPLG